MTLRCSVKDSTALAHGENELKSTRGRAEGSICEFQVIAQRLRVLPFEACGLPWSTSPWLMPLGRLLGLIGPLAELAAASINESLVISLICLPPALVYFVWILIARFAEVSAGSVSAVHWGFVSLLQCFVSIALDMTLDLIQDFSLSTVTPDEWLLVTISFFMLGR